MRPQNGKRGRSRGRNKGGHGNLNRTLESNGPDVKIRGSAAHIHEKYLTLARDAHSSGDRVGAENYLQHAEHYHRLMMAALPPGQTLPYGQSPYNGGEAHGDDGDEGPETGEALPQQYQPQQPNGGYQPPRGDRFESQPRHDHRENREPREQRDYRDRYDNRERYEARETRDNRGERPDRGEIREGQEMREQPRDPMQGQGPRENREQREPRERHFQDRRLNGRSRRVQDDRMGADASDRPITTLDNAGAAAPAVQSPAPEPARDESDEALG